MEHHRNIFIVFICLTTGMVAGIALHFENLADAATQNASPADKHIEEFVNKGEELLRKNNFQEALNIYTKILSLYQQADDSQYEAETYVIIGEIYNYSGKYDEALQHFDQAVEIFQELENREDEAMTLIYIGRTHLAWNRYEEALEILQNAVNIAEEIDDHAGKWSTLKSLGDVNLKSGRFENALETYTQALEISGSETSCRSKLTLVASIGSAHTALGQYREAILYQQQALNILNETCDDLEDKEPETKNLEGEILLSIGITYLRLGDYHKALDILQDALTIFRETQHKAREATTLANVGGIYEERGEYIKAIGIYKQALRIHREKQNSIGLAVTLNNIAKASDRFCLNIRHPKHHKDALDYYEEALEKAENAGAQMIEAKILNNIGELRIHLSEYHKKAEYLGRTLILLQNARNIQREIHDQSNEWITLSNIGQVCQLQGKYQEALRFYQMSIELLEEITTFSRIEEFTISLRAQAVETYQRVVLLLMYTGQQEQAFEFSERARARAFLDQLGNTRVNIRSNATGADIERARVLRGELIELERNIRKESQKPKARQNHELIQFLEKQLEKKRREYEDIRITIKVKNPEYNSLLTVEPLNLRDVQTLLNPGTTLLSYFVTQKKTLAFVITRDSFKTVELPVGEEELKSAIDEVRKPAGVHDPVPDALKSLYEKLVTPVKPHLTTPLIGIIPHGVLHYLPFAALTDGKRYLCDEYTLFFLPSATTLKFLQEKRKPSDNTVLAMANSHAEGLSELAFADQEVQAIAIYYARYYNSHLLISGRDTLQISSLRKTQEDVPLLGGPGLEFPLMETQWGHKQRATETAFKNLASQFSILHLAAHAKLNTRNPLFSRILLSSDEKNDGTLEVHEIYELDLEKTNLVVLSACNTKLGKISRGDDIIGLNRAFIYAGAPSVLASLWKVDDLTTRDFMIAFYLQLTSRKSKADALRAAYRITRYKYPHPYYWAGFVLTGAP